MAAMVAVEKVWSDAFFVSVDLEFYIEIAPAATASAIFFHSWLVMTREIVIFALVKLLFNS